MIIPYFYSLQNDVMSHINSEEIKRLEEWVENEEKTEWHKLISHVSDPEKKTEKLTCKSGCCSFTDKNE